LRLEYGIDAGIKQHQMIQGMWYDTMNKGRWMCVAFCGCEESEYFGEMQIMQSTECKVIEGHCKYCGELLKLKPIMNIKEGKWIGPNSRKDASNYTLDTGEKQGVRYQAEL